MPRSGYHRSSHSNDERTSANRTSPDYCDVDHLRTLQGLDALSKRQHPVWTVKIIHRLGHRHTSDQHPWFRQRAGRTNQRGARRKWYVWDDPKRRRFTPPRNGQSVSFGARHGPGENCARGRPRTTLHPFLPEQPATLHVPTPKASKDAFDRSVLARFWFQKRASTGSNRRRQLPPCTGTSLLRDNSPALTRKTAEYGPVEFQQVRFTTTSHPDLAAARSSSGSRKVAD